MTWKHHSLCTDTSGRPAREIIVGFDRFVVMTTLYGVARGRKRKLREKVHSEEANEKASEEGRMNREGQADGPVSVNYASHYIRYEL